MGARDLIDGNSCERTWYSTPGVLPKVEMPNRDGWAPLPEWEPGTPRLPGYSFSRCAGGHRQDGAPVTRALAVDVGD